MSLLIPGTNSIKDTGYDVANSLRFESAYLQNPSSGASSTAERRTLTWSIWFKRSKLGADQYLASGRYNSSYYIGILFNSSDQLRVFQNASGTSMDLKTNRVFRDVSAWYHIVVAFDTTQSTSSNRVKIYVNGTQETSFATETYPSQNLATYFGMTSGTDGYPTYIGSDTSNHFSGYMAEVVEIGGSQLNANSFGEFDSDTPTIWKPKDLSDLSFGSTAGTNVYLDFEDSSDLGNDISGGNNDYSLNSIASTDQSTDTCTNNFATFNSLLPNLSSITYSEGNLKANATAWRGIAGTILVNTGKWYAEFEFDAGSYVMIGIVSEDDMNNNGDHYGTRATGYQYYSSDGTIRNNDSTVATYSSYSTGDIIGVCLDCDNNKVYWSKNGTWQNSADPSAGSNGYSITANKYYTFACSLGGTAIANFGSPTTSISSSNSDPNGYGNFEYGTENFYTLNTKNLAEFG